MNWIPATQFTGEVINDDVSLASGADVVGRRPRVLDVGCLGEFCRG